MKPIDLCLATQFFYPYYAGDAARFMGYLPGLQRRQIKTRVFTGTPPVSRANAYGAAVTWSAYAVGDALPVESVNDAPVHRIRLPDNNAKLRTIRFSSGLVHYCAHPRPAPDLIQLLPLPYWSIPWMLRLRRRQIPLLYAVTLLNEPPGATPLGLLQWQLRRLQLSLVDAVVVNSRLMQQTVLEMGIRSPVYPIPNGVDTNRFRPVRTSQERMRVRHALGIPAQAPVLMTVGAVEPRKGTDLLLEAWVHLAKTCRHSQLVIVGPRTDVGDPERMDFHRRLQALLEASGAQDRVHFTGRVDAVEKYLQAADLFVFTSKREGSPNVVLEAMATGLPVVMTPFVGLSEELGRSNEHFALVDRDPEGLAILLEQLLQDKKRAAAIGEAGRAWIEANMDLERSIDEYASLYHSVARGCTSRYSC